jgi:hypothetical protein
MWTLRSDSKVPHWFRDAPGDGAVLAYSTRRGGTSAPPFDSLNLGRSTTDVPERVVENRHRFLSALGLDASRLVTAGQVHGARVLHADRPGHVADCDAIVTTRPDLALAVTIADCMALLYRAPHAVGAAHSGWRGTAAGMPAAALRTVAEASGCPPGEVDVHIGPCIRACCYEVGDDVARHFPPAVIRRGGGQPRLDLPAAARLALLSAGVPHDRIHDTGACSACEPHWYFSHRRDAGRTGRMWGLAALRGSG